MSNYVNHISGKFAEIEIAVSSFIEKSDSHFDT